MCRSAVVFVLLVHLGFHTFWALLYYISLLGVFALVPVVGCYIAFVLGFLGKSVLVSTTVAVALGYVAFSATGLLSGFLISFFRPANIWVAACASVLLSVMLMIGATLIHYKSAAVSGLRGALPIPVTTGRPDAEDLAWALKGQSLDELPLYLAGKSTLIPFSELQPSLSLLPKDFRLGGGPHVYLNLPPQVWRALGSSTGSAKYPVLWATSDDPSGRRLVISVDLKTDVFHNELVSSAEIRSRLGNIEAVIRRQTGDGNFRMQE